MAIVLLLTLERELANPWERAIAMLVVACPFALILATPTAMVASLSSAAALRDELWALFSEEQQAKLDAVAAPRAGGFSAGGEDAADDNPFSEGDDEAALQSLLDRVGGPAKSP